MAQDGFSCSASVLLLPIYKLPSFDKVKSKIESFLFITILTTLSLCWNYPLIFMLAVKCLGIPFGMLGAAYI